MEGGGEREEEHLEIERGEEEKEEKADPISLSFHVPPRLSIQIPVLTLVL